VNEKLRISSKDNRVKIFLFIYSAPQMDKNAHKKGPIENGKINHFSVINAAGCTTNSPK
jgi:hypothetical protein